MDEVKEKRLNEAEKLQIVNKITEMLANRYSRPEILSEIMKEFKIAIPTVDKYIKKSKEEIKAIYKEELENIAETQMMNLKYLYKDTEHLKRTALEHSELSEEPSKELSVVQKCIDSQFKINQEISKITGLYDKEDKIMKVEVINPFKDMKKK